MKSDPVYTSAHSIEWASLRRTAHVKRQVTHTCIRMRTMKTPLGQFIIDEIGAPTKRTITCAASRR